MEPGGIEPPNAKEQEGLEVLLRFNDTGGESGGITDNASAPLLLSEDNFTSAPRTSQHPKHKNSK